MITKVKGQCLQRSAENHHNKVCKHKCHNDVLRAKCQQSEVIIECFDKGLMTIEKTKSFCHIPEEIECGNLLAHFQSHFHHRTSAGFVGICQVKFNHSTRKKTVEIQTKYRTLISNTAIY